MIKRIFYTVVFLLMAGAVLRGKGTLKDFKVMQRWPWNGKVDITFSVEKQESDADKSAALSLSGLDRNQNQPVELKSLTGDVDLSDIEAGGPYHLVWDSDADCPSLNTSDFEITATLETCFYKYLVIDLSGGATASSYPFRYSNAGPDLSDDTCRTTELWLKWMPYGSFVIDNGRQVAFSHGFYIGVFECTQSQWNLVMGSNPSNFNELEDSPVRPVENVSYDMIRGTGSASGAGWPAYGYTVDADSFMGRIQAKTGLIFDLPTDAQWEYACSAGGTWACGGGEINEFAWHAGNSDSATHKVGTKSPNSWDLYDMLGNVQEWCLDWLDDDYPSDGAITNPRGAASGLERVLHGGCWSLAGIGCNAEDRFSKPSSNNENISGFRAVVMPKDFFVKLVMDDKTLYKESGEIVTVTAPDKEGYFFDFWTCSGIDIDDRTLQSITFTMPDYEVTLGANYSRYLVIDLSNGASADSYSCRYSGTPPDLSDNTCRTTELWLRWVSPGEFDMGGGSSYHVTLTQGFYIGIFECTQSQWNLVMGTTPSYFSGEEDSSVRPVERVNYNMIRGTGATAGAGWPEYGHAVDEDSFIGRLQSRTGLVIDLPTEAQWEYACRAGTTDAYHGGAVGDVAWYKWNSENATHKVGTKAPNNLGLYDMLGNVWEWCLDWNTKSYPKAPATDPVGPATGKTNQRGLRGCSYQSTPDCCTVTYYTTRTANYPYSGSIGSYDGLRIVMIPSAQ